MNKLIALAERCEAAAGSDLSLNDDIARELHMLDGRLWSGLSKPYTASLDAAMTLVPERHKWNLRGDASGCLPFSYNAEICGRRTGLEKPNYGTATTPALALCAAALRARALDVDQSQDQETSVPCQP